MASIHDIAKRAGVSIATVSRVINHSAPVKSDKEARIREALEYYNWQPNQFGRGLRRQMAGMIGLYVGNTDNSYTRGLINGVSSLAMKKDTSLVLIFDGDMHESGCPRYLTLAQQKKIDGLIFSFPPHDEASRKAIEVLSKENFPIVYIGKKATDYGSNVYARYEEYTVNALEHLVGMGHRHIIIYVATMHQEYAQRAIQHMKESDSTLDILTLRLDDDCVAQAIRESLETHVAKGPYTALVNLGYDNLDIFQGQLEELGLSVPQDVSVVLMDNTREGSASVFPGYTANHVPSIEMGRAAATLLFAQIEGRADEDQSLEMDTRFVQRNSVRKL